MIIVATGNEHKFWEIALTLKEFGIEAEQRRIDIKEGRYETLEEIAIDKARQAFEQIKQPLIVDDTGVFFKAYNNFPGPFPKYVFNSLGFSGIMQLLENKDRSAYFKSLICFIDENGHKVFEGRLNGRITLNVHECERLSLPYERIFVPENNVKPLSLLSLEEKIKFSHRAEAVRKFAEFYNQMKKDK